MIKTQCTPLKILTLHINHKVITYAASLIENSSIEFMFPTVSRHKGKCRHVLLHKKWWISLVDLRKNFLTHTVISPSYYDSQCSFSLYHCSLWPAHCFLSTLPGFEAAIPALCCAPDAHWYRQYLRTSLWFTKYLYLTWNIMQNKIAKH